MGSSGSDKTQAGRRDASARTPLQPGATLGVLGGGQLGRMFAHAATQMGYRVVVLDPAETGPAAEVASEHLRYCLLYTSPSPRDLSTSRMPSSA